ncbi:MAG: ornithine--oxo-acid transaminase [Gammaproteobacteria bacterium]|nr:ornithine--oxo-acid transaminase [Gammaproteobacteria bacterium]MBU1722306.1 ornithine--oxo-acid transaminase [Gammaproteobacteria bacterium]MBU2006761.1 ornithine--oxo-acid transaminase [Gammaproteobacteria bacterium]
MNNHIELENRYCAHNYAPLPVVLCRGEGVHVWDTEGVRYMDMMSAYSAVSHGHAHPRLVKALRKQAGELGVVSRAFYSDKLGEFLRKACQLTHMDMALPMNSGTEAVETALKAARKWAYNVKGVAENQAEIIVCKNNFHGRTLSIVGFSSEAQYRKGFGPFPAGFKQIPFNDAAALEAAITPNTAAFLVEPIQGEGGIIIPDEGYLAHCETVCRKRNVLLLCDEIQTGLGRTGRLLACEHEHVRPDGLMLGKALGGGLLPVSLFLARKEVMDVFTPGDHGSTFGGNPLAAAVGLEALNTLVDEHLVERAAAMGHYFMRKLHRLHSPLIREIRGKGLMIGMEIDANRITGRQVCEVLAEHQILSKETHQTVIRFTPPLVIDEFQIDWAVRQISRTFRELEKVAWKHAEAS